MDFARLVVMFPTLLDTLNATVAGSGTLIAPPAGGLMHE
tara:strand:+ start:130 stop:246 length:117 start_codon:yes stop_codon:yes gene_type:complete